MQTISQYSLHDELHHRLRRMIIDGQFEPGDKIPEKQLCKQFDVSRTPLREALKVLAAEGLVELTPNRGAMVATLTLEEFHDSRPVTYALMDQCAELAGGEISDDEIAKVKDRFGSLQAAYSTKNFQAMVDACRQIREIISNAAHSNLFKLIFDALFFRMSWNRLVLHLTHLNSEIVLSDHEKIVSALEARDTEALAAAFKAHLMHVYEICPDDRLPSDFAKAAPSQV